MHIKSLVILVVVTMIVTGCARQANAPETMTADTSSDVVEVTPTPALPPELRLLASGDVMLARHVGRTMHAEGIDYPFRRITLVGSERFFYYNEFLINHEGAINGYDDACRGCFSFSFADESAGMLADHGVSLASLANNHGLDRGQKGYQRTRELLLAAAITPFGKLYDIDPELSVATREYVSPTDPSDVLRVAYIGLAVFPPFDEDQAAQLIRDTAATVDRVIVVVHWGNEYQHYPSTTQKTLAHTWIDSGADVIIGHHSHVTQSIEIYDDVPIFYSLGNFVFDQYFSDDVQQGLLVGLTMTRDSWEARLYPLRSERAQPALAEGTKRQELLDFLVEISPELSEEQSARMRKEGIVDNALTP